MPEVYIDSLTLENFGPYYGEHSFNFGPLEGQCGILVGGKNGAGKTHLLRALYLAVVGEAGVVDLKKVEPASEATRFVFEKSLNRRALSEGQDTVRFEVAISQRDERVERAERQHSSGKFVTGRTLHRYGDLTLSETMALDGSKMRNISRSCAMGCCLDISRGSFSSTQSVVKTLASVSRTSLKASAGFWVSGRMANLK